jgi:predicted permease
MSRNRRERELDEELRAHLAMAIRDRVERGEDPQAAELAARREFGNRALIQETTRDIWGWRFIEEVWQDARYALRGMRASPGFTAVAVASLALGIGANTAIFSLVYTVMLRPLPVAHPEQLVELLQKYPGEPRGNGYWTSQSYEHYRDRNHVFSAITGTAIDNRLGLQTEGSEPGIVIGEYVLENYFSVLGVKPAIGRLLAAEHDSVAVISWSLWDSRFNRDAGILGRKIFVDGAPVVVVGVAPRDFVGLRVGARTDVWSPAKPTMGLNLLARLKPGVTLQQARAEMALLFRFTVEKRAAKSPDPQVRNLNVELEHCGAGLTGIRDAYGNPLSVLMAVVAVLLLLACLNIAGMLLARGAGRGREMALRLGLGASRGRLLRQMLTESLLLSAAGTLAGAVIAYFGASTLVRIMGSGREHDNHNLEVPLDAGMLLFTAGVAILTGLLFGLAPALSAFRGNPALALRQSGGAVQTRLGRQLGKALLASQLALSVLLLSSAGLFVAHLSNLKHADLGFRRDHVLLVSLDPSQSGYRGERLSAAYRDLLDRLQTIPGVRSASLSAPTPIQGAGAGGFGTAEGFEERPEGRRRISISWVAPKYFETLGTPILAGRAFAFEDQANSRIAIINQTLARHYFAGRDPIGKRITLDHVTNTRDPATYEIVGVAGDANYLEIREPERRALYLPAFRDGRVTAGSFVIRTDVDPESISSDVRRVVRESTQTIPVTRIITLADQIDASIVPERLIASLSGFFAVLGALLAGIGVYGLLAYTVTRRTNEIGIRLALGATSGGVLRMILKEALAIVAAGLILGVPMAIWGRTLAATLIRDVTTDTAASFALGAAAIVAVALVASYVPARRAARVDPMESLRHE